MRPRAMAGVIAAAAAGGARPATADYYYPQMIHLSLTGRPGEMAVDWVSSCADGTSSVMFADNPAHANASTAPAVDHASAATDLGMARTNYTLHYALMTGLKPGVQYYYKLGCVNNMTSEPLSFQAWPPADRQPIWACYGDLGLGVDTWRELAPSIPVLADEAANGVFDAVLHAGDYACECSSSLCVFLFPACEAAAQMILR